MSGVSGSNSLGGAASEAKAGSRRNDTYILVSFSDVGPDSCDMTSECDGMWGGGGGGGGGVRDDGG